MARPGLLLLLATAGLLAAGPAEAAQRPGEELTLSVLTMSPGEHPYFLFGHTALWIHDARFEGGDADYIYNFGTFDVASPLLVPDFLRRRLWYWLSVARLDWTLEEYGREGRGIRAQQLDLEPEERRRVAEQLFENARPKNRFYRYDFFHDNCATRMRDLLDQATGGALLRQTPGTSPRTYREIITELAAPSRLVSLGVLLGLSRAVDQPISTWDAIFLPAALEARLATAVRPRPGGGTAPLVVRTHDLLLPHAPPRRARGAWGLAPLGALGAAGGASLGALSLSARRARRARLPFALGVGAAGLVAGALGVSMLLLWAVPGQPIVHHNENLLQCAPWGLALAAQAPGLARGRPGSEARVCGLLSGSAAASLLGLSLKALPTFHQANGPVIALLLPFWGLAALGVWLARRIGAG